MSDKTNTKADNRKHFTPSSSAC